MEAYYSRVPLLIISADRPRAFRGSGAPQAAEQVGIFGIYTPFVLDIELGENPSLTDWRQNNAAQLNVCFEESYHHSFEQFPELISPRQSVPVLHNEELNFNCEPLHCFFEQCNHPIAIVGTLLGKDREIVKKFLLQTGLPTYCEGPSGIREWGALGGQRLTSLENIWRRAEICGTPIDGILRLGGVPTTRLWRDLENDEHKKKIHHCSISHLPFSGLSGSEVVYTDIARYLAVCHYPVRRSCQLIESDRQLQKKMRQLLAFCQGSEPSLFQNLSDVIPHGSLLYLGNSLPIREWDLAASYEEKSIAIEASRGLNGIDGQISTFLGLTDANRNNWAILGDLTALYDLSAPWIMRQLKAVNITIVVINNGGGKIFSRLFSNQKIQNNHNYSLKPMADLWGLDYLACKGCKGQLPIAPATNAPRLIECIPDAAATELFWKEYTHSYQVAE